jgi:hypothetical protein
MKTPYQLALINWLGKVTNDPVVQGARPVNVINLGLRCTCPMVEDGDVHVPTLGPP